MAIPVLLFAVAFVARAVSALLFVDAAYPDSYYYASVASSLAEGRGFEVDYIWSFVDVGGVLPEQGVLPIPSNGHWMPLAALVQVPFLWLMGPTPLAAALPFWIASGLAASLTWYVGRDAGLRSWQSAAAGLLVALPGGLAPYLAQPDNFSIFMLLGALALWLCARGLRGDRLAFVAGGVVVGLATLSRTDGALLGVPYALGFAAGLLSGRRGGRPRIGWRTAVLCAAGFAIVVGPWLLRQLDVFGSILPSGSGGRILWVVEHDEIFSVTTETTPTAFFRQELGTIVAGRLGGLGAALTILAVMPLAGVLVPFFIVGLLTRRRDPEFTPWLIYAAALLSATLLVFALYVTHGFFIHSGVALVPHAYVLAVGGIGTAVTWVSRRRAHWDAAQASRAITAMLVAVVMLASLGATAMTFRSWTQEMANRRPLIAALADIADPSDRVMSPDPGAYRYHGGFPGIVTPADPLPVVAEAARLYGVRWLALEADHIVPSLVPVLTGEVRPTWLSQPVIVLQADEATDGSGDAGDVSGRATRTGAVSDDPFADLPRAALYAVCLEPDDHRCDR
jgi:4-amino-4-deoxy-L-arabinose transferase-like glycosyltransferase